VGDDCDVANVNHEKLIGERDDLKTEVLKNDVWRMLDFWFEQRIIVDKRFNCPNFQEKKGFFQTGRKSTLFFRRKKSIDGQVFVNNRPSTVKVWKK
jgi:hypothetical protein